MENIANLVRHDKDMCKAELVGGGASYVAKI